MATTTNKKNANTRVVTGRCRLSYAHLFEPYASGEDDTPKYSVVLLIPKTDTETYNKLRAAQQVALEAGITSRFNGKLPKVWTDTIHDGDDEDEVDHETNPEYKGHWFMSVSSKTRPGIVDRNVQPILDSSEVYSGCYARVEVGAFAFNTQGNKGVSFGLNNVQKLADGDILGGRSRAEDVFDAVDDDDDDEDDLI